MKSKGSKGGKKTKGGKEAKGSKGGKGGKGGKGKGGKGMLMVGQFYQYILDALPNARCSQFQLGNGYRVLKGKGGKGGGGSKGSADCVCCPGTGSRDVTALELSFVMLSPNASFPAIDTNNVIEPVGTTWIYNSGLLTMNATALLGASVIGYCIRLQEPVGTTAADAVSGKGYCHLTYTIVDEASNQVTFNADGEVIDLTGGTLAITGGTGALQGVDGELVLVPSFVDTKTEFNFFTQAAFYLGVATLFIQGY